jgi:drug/metabolite transporter (DMT)-like permease
MVVMGIASSLACMPAAVVLPLPQFACWPAILISAVIHVAYNLFLVRAYAHGDLGQVYPIARGSSPPLVTLGAALLARETPSRLALAGITLVSLGIFSLARGWAQGASRSGMRVAFATGALIAAYTVTDGLGARLSKNPASYAAWLFILEGVPMPLIYWIVRGWRTPLLGARAETAKGAAGGLVSLLAYGMVIWAASVGPMGSVSALRETSVVFAALLGRLFLAEDLPARRLASCMPVALGAFLLGRPS